AAPAIDAAVEPDASVPPPPPVIAVAAAEAHSCVVIEGGTVRCWGLGSFGRLGHVDTNTIGDDETAGCAGDVDVGGAVAQISVGDQHTCALLDGGALRCWGRGASGRLGYANLSDIGDDEAPATAGDVDVGGAVQQVVM